MLCLAFFSHSFAYAADIDSIRPEDHSRSLLFRADLHLSNSESDEIREDGLYEAGFLGYDQGISGRAPTSDDPTELENNIARTDNLARGQSNFYMFPSTALGLRIRSSEHGSGDIPLGNVEETNSEDPDLQLQTRADPKTVYISVNVCSQPQPAKDTKNGPPPQLQLFISQTDSNTKPGPESQAAQDNVTLVQGAVMHQVQATGNVYLGLFGANAPAYQDMWSAEIAVSTDRFYHTYTNNSGPNINLLDSDSSSALLITGVISNSSDNAAEVERLESAPPYVLFASKSNNTMINGLRNSYCGLQQNADIKPLNSGKNPGNIQTGLKSTPQDGVKQQFYVGGIAKGTTYNVILAEYGGGNATSNTRRTGVAGGGGTVFPEMQFTTMSGKPRLALLRLLSH